jgi:protein gp37
MSANSNISWTDNTWPIVAGCEYESPGCANCWAVRDSWRLAHHPNPAVSNPYAGTVRKTADGKLIWTGVVRTLPERLTWPLGWRKRKRIFVCSQADLFHPAVPFEFIAAVYGVMVTAHWHTYQVLTKHAARMLEFFEWLLGDPGPVERINGAMDTWVRDPRERAAFRSTCSSLVASFCWPPANVWVGVTVEDQKRADERIPLLLQAPVALRWISAEPLLEEVNVASWLAPKGALGQDRARSRWISWVVAGGESAQTRRTTREFDVAWARSLLAQCVESGTAFFMKQLGTVPVQDGISLPGMQWPSDTRRREAGLGKVYILHPVGRTSRYKWHEPRRWPLDVQVQEFPRTPRFLDQAAA